LNEIAKPLAQAPVSTSTASKGVPSKGTDTESRPKKRSFEEYFMKKTPEPQTQASPAITIKQKVAPAKKRPDVIGVGKSISCGESNDESEEEESGELSGSFIAHSEEEEEEYSLDLSA
jgi:hypothetical protein